jgi:hypothetical protein
MNLADAGNQVRDQILAAAALGDDRTREIAAALATTADSAVRLAVLQALTAASTELADALTDAAATRGLPWIPEISVQLDGDRLGFAVAVFDTDTEQPAEADAAAGADGGTGPDRGEATARISLRLSETLKAGIEQAAERAEISVNSWLIRIATAALHEPNRSTGDGGASWQGSRGGKRVTGWLTG